MTKKISTGPSHVTKNVVDEKRVRQILGEVDVNGDNYLSWGEIQKAFRQLGAWLPPWRALCAVINADANGDGLIGPSERDSLVRYILNWYNGDAQR